MQSSHAEFGPSGFPQQYAFAPSMAAVSANSTHDMSKQVQAAQPGMYSSNSGGMPPSVQQHHQSAMGGPAPSPQPASLVQGQHMNRGHIQNMSFFPTRNTPSRAMTNMRNPMANVVNQTGQPPTQYPSMQMLQSHPSFQHTMAPTMLMAPQITAQMYPRQYQQQQYSIVSAAPHMYVSGHWNGYTNPTPNANGFYPSHMSTYNPMPPQPTIQSQTSRPRRALPIIDPSTGKNILPDDEPSSHQESEKEVENADASRAQFATQVATAALAVDKHEPLKPPIEDASTLDTQPVVLCHEELGIVEMVEEPENGELETVCEQYNDIRNISCQEKTPPISLCKKDSDLNSINENTYDSKKLILEQVHIAETQETNYNNNMPEVATEYLSENASTDMAITSISSEQTQFSTLQEINTPNVQLNTETIVSKVTSEISKPNQLPKSGIIESQPAMHDSRQSVFESRPPLLESRQNVPERLLQSNGEMDASNAPVQKAQDRPPSESKKNKAKKKKDLNKRGESKEGGEMDAFIDKGDVTDKDTGNAQSVTATQQVSPIPPPSSPPPPPSPIQAVNQLIARSKPPLSPEKQRNDAPVEKIMNEAAVEEPRNDAPFEISTAAEKSKTELPIDKLRTDVPVEKELTAEVDVEKSVDAPAERIRTSSPAPIMDREVLSAIPLPEECVPVNATQNDATPTETPVETSPASPNSESEDKENLVVVERKLKYNYKEDQWSPLNPEGKKQYDREFLLLLQSEPMSMRKPTNLPNLDVIKDKAHIQKLTEVNRAMPMAIPIRPYSDPFVPSYVRGGAPRPPHPALNRRSQQGRDKPKKIITFSSSLNQTVKLHESENAWKPSYKGEPPVEDNAELQDLNKKVRGILNKLTPQKFTTLVEQVRNLDINTEEKLRGVIDLIFEKAIDEPNFSVPYANMCKQLAMIKVPLAGQQGQLVNFRKLLLTKCQKEFEQDRSEESFREEKQKQIDEAESEEKRKEYELQLAEQEKKMRYRQLGNIRFIGELFKLHMLTESIMHECIGKLINQHDEESLECLCRLLKTIGKELDETKKPSPNPTYMDVYFNKMQRIVEKRQVSSRVRFMLQDVIELKNSNWIPRRDENNPKTIDQIHQEAEREAHEQQQVLQNMSYSKRPDDRDRRKAASRNIGSEDGWTPSSKGKSNYNVVDPSKLKLTKQDEFDSIRLGPGGRGPQSWSRGSSGGTKTLPSESEKPLLANKFSLLSEQTQLPNLDGRRGSQRSAASSRESSRNRNQLPSARKTPSTSKERESLIEAVKGLRTNVVEQQKPKEDKKAPERHVNGKVPAGTPLPLNAPESSATLKGQDLSEDEIERETKQLLDEFVHNSDLEEAIRCVTELASPSTVHLFIKSAINQVLERSSHARSLLGQLFYLLIKQDVITIEDLKQGFQMILDIVTDLELDIPKIWEYLGELLEPLVEENKLPLVFLKEILQPCIPSQVAGKIVATLLLCTSSKKGTVKLGELWKDSGLQWEDFLGEDLGIEAFIQRYELEFTVSSTKIQPNNELTIDKIKSHLSFLLEEEIDSKPIFDWIDANVAVETLTESPFIRALVTVVCENAVSGSGGTCEIDAHKLKRRIPLLSRYIHHNENLQLQALYATQALMNQLHQPKGILRQIFDCLYDDDVITEEAFKQWELSDDPAEQEGRGVAVLSARPFFTWLRETDVESDDEGECAT